MSIVVRNLSATYGQASALRDVSIDVGPGEIVGLLGRNGAGKTTLLRAITGLHRERQGSVGFAGVDVSNRPAHEIALSGVSLVREGGVMPLSMTVHENLLLGQRLGRARQRGPRSLDEVYALFPLLTPLKKRMAGVLSGGERQTLALATAYVSHPAVLLLDEPSAGLSPQTASSVFDVIAELASESNLTVLIVEQNAQWLERLGARSYLLDVGEIVDETSVGL